MGVKQRLAALERRKRKAERACDDCGGHGVPVITYDGVVDREPCAGCGKSYVLMAFVGWAARDDGDANPWVNRKGWPTSSVPASPP